MWRTPPLTLRSEAKSRVSKDAPEGGARTGGCWSVLRGRFAAPQDEGVGMKCAELPNQDTNGGRPPDHTSGTGRTDGGQDARTARGQTSQQTTPKEPKADGHKGVEALS